MENLIEFICEKTSIGYDDCFTSDYEDASESGILQKLSEHRLFENRYISEFKRDSKYFADDLVTVDLTDMCNNTRCNLKFAENIKLYSIMVTPCYFNYLTFSPSGGSLLLPTRINMHFEPFKGILTNININRIFDSRSDDIPLTDDKTLLGDIPTDNKKIDAYKQSIIDEFTEKIDKLFACEQKEINSFELIDVPLNRKIFLRVSKDSVVYG